MASLISKEAAVNYFVSNDYKDVFAIRFQYYTN